MFQQLQALVILAESLTIFHEKKLADLALKNRLPTMFGFREFADAGGLISYGSLNVVCCETTIRLESGAKQKCLARLKTSLMTP
jgi:hypothetical protein